ncbi:MAG: TRAP transporter small permease subunit [Acidobacteria bacterium]|nr:TRAP transporter small permease subunit [Acidobacteriota bacterium]
MVLIGAYNAVARYLGRGIGINLSSNAYLEAQWYLFSLVFLLGAAYTFKHDNHVRVDVLYGRLSRRGKTIINLIGTALFLLPFSIFSIWVSWPSVRNSWAVLEGSPDPGGLPRYPIKTMIIVAFVLLALQGVAELIRGVQLLRSGELDASGEEL